MLDKIMIYIALGAMSILVIGFILFVVSGLISVIKDAFEDKKHIEFEDWLLAGAAVVALCLLIPTFYFVFIKGAIALL